MRHAKLAIAVSGALAMLLAAGDAASAGRGSFRLMNKEGNGNLDIAVRQVTVSPVRAHVGDVVRVDVVIENKAEGYQTVTADVRANGKAVSRKLFTFGASPADRIYRESFLWDTRAAAPGEYRISAEVFVWEDTSPSDNSLDVKEPVLLVAPGAPFPGGKQAGGSATEKDPRFGKSSPGGSEPAGGAGDGGGY